MAKPPSHAEIPAVHDECLSERRFEKLEDRMDAAEKALGDGRIEFAEIRKDLAQIMLQLTEMKAAMVRAGENTVKDKIIEAAIHWGVPLVGAGVLWAIFKSGAVHP